MMKTNNKLLPVYLLVGSDKLRQKAVLDRLDVRLNELGDMSFNCEKFDGSEATAGEIINACNTIPFLSQVRYVQVANADKLNKDNTEELIKYLKEPTQTTILVLVCEKLAKNTRLYKAVISISPTCVINCEPPKKYELVNKLNAFARSHGGSIALNAATKLIELVGEDTVRLDSEIKKMLVASGTGHITIQDVELFVARTSSAKPWDFTNAFAARNISTALNAYYNMPEGSEYSLLPMTCNRIKELICVKGMGPTTNKKTISKELGIQEWQAKNHSMWARNFTLEELENTLANALKTEVKMKSTSDSALAFEMFVVETLRRH